MLFSCCSNVLAFNISKAERLGFISSYMASKGGIYFYGGTGIKGNSDKYLDGREYYGSGIVRYGTGKEAIYIHYNTSQKYYCNARVGGRDFSNTIDVFLQSDVIFRMNTDSNIKLYGFHYGHSCQSFYTIVGTTSLGKFVKYIDTREITKRYFGEKAVKSIKFYELSYQGDTIVIPYRFISGAYGTDISTEGEFRFKWDDSAQWFSIEQIVY